MNVSNINQRFISQEAVELFQQQFADAIDDVVAPAATRIFKGAARVSANAASGPIAGSTVATVIVNPLITTSVESVKPVVKEAGSQLIAKSAQGVNFVAEMVSSS